MSNDKEQFFVMELMNYLRKFNFIFIKTDKYKVYIKGQDDIKNRMASRLINKWMKGHYPQSQLLVKWV